MKKSSSRLRGRGGVLAVACLAAMSVFTGLAPTAGARRVSVSREPCPIRHVELDVSYTCAIEFTLRGSDGYRITISGDPNGAGPDQVRLRAEGHSGTAEYSVEGSVTTTAIRATFGQLGRVSVRFSPSGAVRRIKVPRSCASKLPRIVTSRLGRFRGTIEFRGERDYTRVSADRAWGGIGDPLANTTKKLTCEFHESKAEKKRELESVSLDASPAGAGVSFTAFRAFGSWAGRGVLGGHSSPQARYAFFALAFERAAGMTIFRTAAALGGSAAFVFDDALTTAMVKPPAPFTGTGSFLRNADGSITWTGDLGVAIPGLGTVRLTGGDADLATVATHLQHLEEELSGH